jgi:protein TonB
MKWQKLYKRLLLLCIFLLSGVLLRAQSQADLDTALFQLVEKMPEYPGGVREFEKFVQKRLGIEIQGEHLHLHKKVYVQFVINKSGQVQNVQLLQGVNEEIDKKVLDIVQQSPKWIPGRQRGVPVYVRTAARIYVE